MINKYTIISLSKAKQSKAKQSKAKQSKAKQSKAKQSHNCLLNNNFKFYISQFLKAFKFLSVSILLQKTRGFNPLRSSAIAHNGLKPHCYKKWVATPSLRLALNDNENNFAIPNLVKSFLTLIKFKFDSLSRKIKNPCLVINKNSLLLKRIFS